MNRAPLLVAVVALFGASGCVGNHPRIGELQSESQSVKLGNARSVRVHLTMGVGTLEVAGGAANLLDARFTYNVPAWEPRVEYTVGGDQGELTIEQPGTAHSTSGGEQYDWDLRFNDDVPLVMNVEVGAGRAKLALGALSLNRLEMVMGAGDADIDLTGDWKKDVSVEINGGVGRAVVHLPRDVGVRVTAAGGIGAIRAPGLKKEGDDYVNDAYGKSPVTLSVDINGGVGEIDLQLGGARQVI